MMWWIQNMFSVYIDIVMLCIGLYMSCVQSKNLVQIDHLNREGKFTRVLGWIYIVVAIAGFVLIAVN